MSSLWPHRKGRPPAPDPAEYPNFAEAVRTGAGLDFAARFRCTLDILINGYAAAARLRDH